MIDLHYIQETNAIVYKGLTDQKWRYSTLDINTGITQTYIIDGMSDLFGSFAQYLLQNNQQLLYFYNYRDPSDSYYIIDLSILTSNNLKYLSINKYANKGCDSFYFVSQYDSLYYYTCTVHGSGTVDNYLWKASSLQDLETATSKVKFNNQLFKKTYIVFDETLLVYKGKEYTNFLSITSIQTIRLYDLKYDIFLFDYQLCKATMTGSTFDCSKKYDLGLNPTKDCIISKVFNSNGKDIIFGFNYKTNNYNFLEAETFNTIYANGDNIISNIKPEQIIQIKNYVYIQSNLYSITYDSQSAKLNIKLITSSLPSGDYTLASIPYDEQNFQYGNFICLYQNSKSLILNIYSLYCPAGCQYCPIQNHNQCCSSNCIECNDEQTCLTCSPGYMMQLDQTCDKTCPISAQIDNINKKCICDPNATFTNKECKCNNSYYLSGNQCQKCQSNCDFCQNSQNCQQCSSGFYLYPNGSCQLCDIQKGFYIKQKLKNTSLEFNFQQFYFDLINAYFQLNQYIQHQQINTFKKYFFQKKVTIIVFLVTHRVQLVKEAVNNNAQVATMDSLYQRNNVNKFIYLQRIQFQAKIKFKIQINLQKRFLACKHIAHILRIQLWVQ
ncbi:hypothetical protein TTHERM_00942880 (macronuclear) [Tetrahymena thermophila SB210]|uniref:Uncharacterized protein n=1 Tax=Tetrahymena thermophila (strain SB210) TaxID=312017 RepID=Q22DJ2_TETTS|nr:hypothetical protein TTHERM_00942880 [Tetrahymena thermophila SB210]EAR83366.2 hypothetical protein TTHERM_00942880 [Tetrahymena thermophila SB210]|eukprot:XP_001031029.2 hypothetical protein TTHERM_00942880 [Tetrahymena thermophila SB210]